MSAGSLRRARMPPKILGCRVFTRPPMTSGLPVNDATSITGRLSSFSFLAVPPVDNTIRPLPKIFFKPVTRSVSPVLSDTLANILNVFTSILHLKSFCTSSCDHKLSYLDEKKKDQYLVLVEIAADRFLLFRRCRMAVNNHLALILPHFLGLTVVNGAVAHAIIVPGFHGAVVAID